MIHKLGPGIYDLNLEPNNMLIHPVLIWNEQDGATLLDTGLIGTLDNLREAVRQTGVEWNDIRRIILTHQDLDHIGNLPAIVSSLPAKPEVWAHEDDSDVIEGRAPFLKMSAERMASFPEPMRTQFEKFMDELKSIKVTRFLKDGESLPVVQGGLQVIHTPGHTPGHLSFYLPDEQLLLAADSMNAAEGRLYGPNESFTPDMPLALKSLSKFVPLAIRQVLCYHGGVYDQQPGEAIQALAQSSK